MSRVASHHYQLKLRNLNENVNKINSLEIDKMLQFGDLGAISMPSWLGILNIFRYVKQDLKHESNLVPLCLCRL